MISLVFYNWKKIVVHEYLAKQVYSVYQIAREKHITSKIFQENRLIIPQSNPGCEKPGKATLCVYLRFKNQVLTDK